MIEKIKIARKKNNEVVRIVKEMKKSGIKITRDEEQQVKEELILEKEKVYIPKKMRSFRQKKLLVAQSNKKCRKIHKWV